MCHVIHMWSLVWMGMCIECRGGSLQNLAQTTNHETSENPQTTDPDHKPRTTDPGAQTPTTVSGRIHHCDTADSPGTAQKR